MEIKPCPFCGCPAKVKEFKRSRTVRMGIFTDRCVTQPLPSQFFVKCPNKDCRGCQPQTRFFDSEEAAVSSWNIRI